MAIVFGLYATMPGGCHHAERADPRTAAVRVLFVGNSYTYLNDLPSIVEELATRTERARPYQESVTDDAMTLERHWDGGRGEAARRIRSRAWTHVVLQEQSQRPIVDRARYDRFARLLAAEADRRGARVVLYLTWAREGHPEEQQRLDEAIGTLARDIGATVAPAGPVWAAARKARPDLELYASDRHHPSPIGSYLTALVMHASLYGQIPARVPEILEHGSETLVAMHPRRAEWLRGVAQRAVAEWRALGGR